MFSSAVVGLLVSFVVWSATRTTVGISLAILTLAVSGAKCWRANMISIVIDEEGITAINFWRKRRLRWDSIARIGNVWLPAIALRPRRGIGIWEEGASRSFGCQASYGGARKRQELIGILAESVKGRNIIFQIDAEDLEWNDPAWSKSSAD